MSYRQLDPASIFATVRRLEDRILARFPTAGLARVCAELRALANETETRILRTTRPNWLLRTAIGALFVGGGVGLAMVARVLSFKVATNDMFGQLQGIEAIFNLAVIVGGSAWFLLTLEERMKRARAMDSLHELRSLVHVIDMHQLTKDPSVLLDGASPSAASPDRPLTPFLLVRYLDYCSEMLSIVAKLAALHAQATRDSTVVEVVSDLERLTSNLSQKIWQKISMVAAQ
jgi:hypothetical protein